ncbi:MAG: septum formation initiator family protein [Proteobacteria bacterium]|nr:septum formation initiator family protein [Pseudomonadota bacterium]
MAQRIVPVVLVALLGVVHGQLWFGRGSLPEVAGLQRTLAEQQAANAKAKVLNDQLASEVADLRAGLGTVEEKARTALGMVRPNEIFVQVNPAPPPKKPQ